MNDELVPALETTRLPTAVSTPPSAGSPSPIGVTVTTDGVNFCLFSRTATGVELLLFDHVDDAKASRVIPFDPVANRTYHYWHELVPAVQAGQNYGYRVQGRDDPSRTAI